MPRSVGFRDSGSPPPRSRAGTSGRHFDGEKSARPIAPAHAGYAAAWSRPRSTRGGPNRRAGAQTTCCTKTGRGTAPARAQTARSINTRAGRDAGVLGEFPLACENSSYPRRRAREPNFARILSTSCPERVLTFGMDGRFEFEGGEHRGIFRQIKLRKILAPKVKTDGLSQVFGQLIERLGLGHDRKIQTLGDILFFAFENADLNDFLHGWTLA